MMTAGMSMALTSRKVLVIETGPANWELNLRYEPLSRINKAIDIISVAIARASSPSVAVQVPAPASVEVVASSKADELKKFAELRDFGVISEKEFQAEKARLLGGRLTADFHATITSTQD